jgi:hypothetical protein
LDLLPWLNNLAVEISGLTQLDLFLWGLLKEMNYRTKVHTRKEPLQRIMDAAAYIRKNCEMIEQAVNSCLERPRLCIGNRGGQKKCIL